MAAPEKIRAAQLVDVGYIGLDSQGIPMVVRSEKEARALGGSER